MLSLGSRVVLDSGALPVASVAIVALFARVSRYGDGAKPEAACPHRDATCACAWDAPAEWRAIVAFDDARRAKVAPEMVAAEGSPRARAAWRRKG